MVQNELLERADAFARERISGKRYEHTLRVADTAERLARLHSLDAERTRLAALLHDSAREVEKEDFLRLARAWKLPVGDFERQSPKLLHGPVAAELARRELGIEDEEVLESIRAHTVGSPGMGGIPLAVFIADKIEPARDYPSVNRIRELADRDLREAATEAIRRTAAYNQQRGKKTHPASLKMLEWLEQTLHPPQRRVQ